MENDNIEQLLEALLPFALYGGELMENPLRKHLPDNLSVGDDVGAPMIKEYILAAEVYKNFKELKAKKQPKPRLS